MILVTGAGGFVGSHVVERLASRGEKVLAVDIADLNEPVKSLWKPYEQCIQFELADIVDKAVIAKLLADYGVDRVVHAATITPTVERELAEPDRILQIGITGTAVVLSASIEHGVKRFVYLSSASIYEPVQDSFCNLDENAVQQNKGLYPLTKVAGEWLIRYLAEISGIETVSARIAACYGPLERNTGARTRMSPVWQMVQKARSGHPISIGSPDHTLDFTHVRDIAEGIANLMFSPRLSFDVYNISGGKGYSFLELAQAVVKHIPTAEINLTLKSKDAVFALDGSRSGRLDITRLTSDTAFVPMYDLESGVAQYINWLSTHEF